MVKKMMNYHFNTNNQNITMFHFELSEDGVNIKVENNIEIAVYHFKEDSVKAKEIAKLISLLPEMYDFIRIESKRNILAKIITNKIDKNEKTIKNSIIC